MGTSIEGGLTLTAPSYPRGIILGDVTEPKQSIYEQSATQQFTLGTVLEYADGRKFRYAKNGTVALTKALMTSAVALTANCYEQAQSTSGTSVEIGDLEITIDVTNASGITDDLYAEGVMVVNKGTGLGDTYKILACKLLTTTTARLLLETPIRTALDATSEVSLIKSTWRDVVVVPTTAVREAAGVPLIAVDIGYYCWLQTGGLCPIIRDTSDTLVVGENAGYPTTPAVAGAAGLPAATDEVWGTVAYIGTDAETAIVRLTLD